MMLGVIGEVEILPSTTYLPEAHIVQLGCSVEVLRELGDPAPRT
jgi:hypothetical protein